MSSDCEGRCGTIGLLNILDPSVTLGRMLRQCCGNAGLNAELPAKYMAMSNAEIIVN